MPATQSTMTAKHQHPRQRTVTVAPTILLIEDDYDMLKMLADVLRADGYNVIECPDAYHVLNFYINTGVRHDDPRHVDLVISDIRMPVISGLELLASRRFDAPCPPTIIITAFGDEQTHARARELGAAALLDKPFEVDDLLHVVRDTIRTMHRPDVGEGRS